MRSIDLSRPLLRPAGVARRAPLALAVGFALLAFAPVARAGCSKDTDCKGDRICSAGTCSAPPAETVVPPAPVATPAPAAAPAELSATDVTSGSAVEPSGTVPPAPGAATPGATAGGNAPQPRVVLEQPETPLPTQAGAPVKDASPAPSHRGRTLIAVGIGSLVTGYLVAVVAASAGSAYGSSQKQQDGATCVRGAPLAFLPLFGPFLSLGQYPDHNIVGYSGTNTNVIDCSPPRGPITVLVVVDEILQLGGAGMLGLGLGLNATAPAQAKPARLEVLPYAPGASAGVSLRYTSF